MSHIFISYSHQDKDYVKQLDQTLKAHHFPTWYDERINPGDEWAKTIIAAVQSAAAVVVVMTPDAMESRWVQREIKTALQSQRRIFPLLLADKSFPILSEYQYENVTSGQMPSDRFFDTLKTVVNRTFSAEIIHFGIACTHRFDYQPQHKSAVLETRLCSFVGLHQYLIDLKFMAVVKADGMSVDEIQQTHADFHHYIEEWRPDNVLQRMLKKHGAISFIFEQGQPKGLPKSVDTEARGLVLTDAGRTEMWYVDFVKRVITANQSLGFPPVISPYLEERKQMENFLKAYFAVRSFLPAEVFN